MSWASRRGTSGGASWTTTSTSSSRATSTSRFSGGWRAVCRGAKRRIVSHGSNWKGWTR